MMCSAQPNIVFSPVALLPPICWHWRQGQVCPCEDSCRFSHCYVDGAGSEEDLAQRSGARTYRLVAKNFPISELELLIRTLEEGGFSHAPHGVIPDLLWVTSSHRPPRGIG